MNYFGWLRHSFVYDIIAEMLLFVCVVWHDVHDVLLQTGMCGGNIGVSLFGCQEQIIAFQFVWFEADRGVCSSQYLFGNCGNE